MYDIPASDLLLKNKLIKLVRTISDTPFIQLCHLICHCNELPKLIYFNFKGIDINKKNQ